MATAGEGGATTNTDAIASSYDGRGGEEVGGKVRKRPFRRAHRTTLYDRCLTTLRGTTTGATNNDNSSSSNKLVVEPASKLISHGAHRCFASVFCKSVPPPPQPPEANNELSDGLQVAIPNSQSGTKEPAGGNSSHPVNHSDIGGISELEQLLKHMTFTRSEIEPLMELLRSRAEEVPVGERTQEALPELASDLGRHQQFSSSPLEEDRNERDRYRGVNTTIANSRVLEDDIASPAELANVYVGSEPSKISPSKLVICSQIGREDARLLSNVPFTPKSPLMSSTTRAAVNIGVPENCFITPRSRGRSAIYNMAYTPYPRVNPTAIFKGSLCDSGSGSLVSDSVTQSMPISFGSSLPSSSMTNITSFASSSANSRVPCTNINFGFSSAASSSESNAVGPVSGPTDSVFNFSVSSAAFSDVGAISSSSSAASGIFSFGLSSFSSSANVVGSTSGATSSVFSFGSSSAASTLGINAASSFSSGTSGIFSIGANSSASASSSATNLVSSGNPTTNLFGSSWQSPKSPILGSTFTSPSPSTGFAFGASLSSFAATSTAPVVFNSSAGASPIPIFSFTTASAATLSSPSLSHMQPVFGNPPAFPASAGNDQMNAEESMAEDTMQSSAPSVPLFGQPTISPSPPGFMFGSTMPLQPNPFQFAGQQNQVAAQNSSPFQASTSLEFNAGGSFLLGSGGGGDKSGSTFTSPSPSTGYAFGASSSSFAATNTTPMSFNSSTGASSIPIFSFTTASAAALSSPSLSHTQPVFGNPPAFAASAGNDQMNAEDIMAADTMQSSAPSVVHLFGQPTISPSPPGLMFGSTVPSSVPLFGQPAVSPSPPGFILGSTVPAQPNLFQFAPQNPSPFQASASIEFNAAGSFLWSHGGGDKSSRKYVKAIRSKNPKK